MFVTEVTALQGEKRLVVVSKTKPGTDAGQASAMLLLTTVASKLGVGPKSVFG